MEMTQTNSEKFKLFLKIMLPVLITQIGMFAMTFFDTVMTGNYSPADLAGVGIGSSIWTPVYTGLSGILVAITPIVSQLIGAKKKKDVPHSVTQGIYLSVLMALVILAVGVFVLNPILDTMSLEPHVRSVAYDYLVALSWGIIPLFLFSVLRYFIDALGQTRMSMIITLLSLPINIVFNYILIFGKFGFSPLGGVGAGYATAVTYWLIMLIAAFAVLKLQPFKDFNILRLWTAISPKEIGHILKIGIPIGLSIFFETSIFSAVTLLMSNYDTITIASHQAAINFSSFLYMLPLSISMALTIIVGFEVGAGRFKDARQYGLIGVSLAVGMAAMFALVLYFARYEVAALYSYDPDVIKMTANFLILALFFQFSDAVMAPIQGVLRGYKDVNVTFVLSLAAFWVIGLPAGFAFSHYTNMGAYGYWAGLIVGLACGAISLGFRLVYIQKKKYVAADQI
ncbi:MAG: MATE family efflux transporter [Bacillus sp. (in: firmicutes)]